MAIRDTLRKYEGGAGKSQSKQDDPTRLGKPADGDDEKADSDDLGMTLSEFAKTGRFVRFRSCVVADDFYLVADELLKPRLPDQTLVVYTAGEMRKLLQFDPGKQDLILFHELKKRFGVEIEN